MSAEVKIKEEPVDPEYDKVVSKIKSEPEDIPDNFFDDIENNDFLNELIDNVEAEELDDGRKSPPDEGELPPDPADDANENDSIGSDEAPLQEQIEKLTRAIRRREKKLAGRLETTLSTRIRSRSRSPSRRSSRRRKSRSRERRRSRSRSFERRRSKSRDGRRSSSRERHSRRRSRSLDRTSRGSRRSRSRSRGHHTRTIDGRRHRSNSRSRSQKSGKKMTFLEELEKIFAAKGQSFPEASKTLSKREKEAILEEVRATTSSGAVNDSFTGGLSAGSHLQPNYPDSIQQIPPLQLPMPIRIKSEPMDYDEIGRIRVQEMDAMEPALKKIKMEKEEEESVESRREKVIKMCAEAIDKLQMSEQSPLKVRFFYTPTVMGRSGMDESLENRSPLNQISNVQFKFNSATNAELDMEQWGLWKLSGTVSNVLREVGYDVAQLIDKLSFKDIPTALKAETVGKGAKKDGKSYASFYTDSGTQTDEATCSTCIIRQLRKFIDKGVQAKPYVGEIAIQTEGDNDLPLMNIIALLNSSQLMALNDFSEVIRSPAPGNAAELYRLREKLIDIYNLSQRPCMMPAKVSTAQAPGYNAPPSHQYFNNTSQPCPPAMYPMQPQCDMNPQFRFQPGPAAGGMLPFQHSMPMQPPYQEPQPVPPPMNMNMNMNIPTPVVSRRDDPRVMRDRERSRDIVPPPPALRPLETSSSSRSYGRGAKSFSSSRR